MTARSAIDAASRKITYRMHSHDVRKYLIADAVRRAESAALRAGGSLVSGVLSPPKHIKRWCVNRSPHVNKKSREHFWMITHKRIVRWRAGPNVPREAPAIIAQNMPGTVAIRMEDDMPGLLALRGAFDLMQRAKAGHAGKEPGTADESVLKEDEKSLHSGRSVEREQNSPNKTSDV